MRARRCTRDGRFVFEISSRSPPSMRSRSPGDMREQRKPVGVGRVRLVPQDPAARARHELERAPVAAVDDRVVAGAEEDEVMLAQPLQERDGLVDLLLAVAGAAPRAASIRRPTTAASRRGPRPRPGAPASERVTSADRLSARSAVEPLDDLDAHHRLAGGRRARCRSRTIEPSSCPLDAEHRVQQGAHGEPLGRDRSAHGVDQERRVGRVGLEHRRAVGPVDDAHRDGVAPGSTNASSPRISPSSASGDSASAARWAPGAAVPARVPGAPRAPDAVGLLCEQAAISSAIGTAVSLTVASYRSGYRAAAAPCCPTRRRWRAPTPAHRRARSPRRTRCAGGASSREGRQARSRTRATAAASSRADHA